MPKHTTTIDLISRRHPEWQEHQLRWRWLLDSLEGGERYRQAVYGYDRRGLPVRNMVRHKREYPDPRDGIDTLYGSMAAPNAPAIDAVGMTTDDDYELRRARTPVPTFVAEAVETHLARVYAREVTRKGPDHLTQWWSNVDGCGTSMDQWMADTVAPMLLTLGQIDLCMDHPPPPEGEEISTRADLERLGLDRCLATFILPENMLWWALDETGNRYAECLVREFQETDAGLVACYRHWTADGSTLYDADGDVVSGTTHPFGRVPIVRVFDSRKPRCRNVGQSRYEGVAERQREYYNRDSELILSDTTQAHPLLQGPEDFLQSDGTIPIGPSWLLPKKKNSNGNATTYEGFDVVDFPKDGADSIRKNKADIRDDVDRDSALVRPEGNGGRAKSGLAKLIDHRDGNNRLAKIARVLNRAEQAIARLALLVLGDGEVGPEDSAEVVINYPADFDLFTAGEVAEAASEFQALVARSGALPMTEGMMLSRLVRLCLPGLGDGQYARCDEEIRAYIAERSKGRTAPVVQEDITFGDTHRSGAAATMMGVPGMSSREGGHRSRRKNLNPGGASRPSHASSKRKGGVDHATLRYLGLVRGDRPGVGRGEPRGRRDRPRDPGPFPPPILIRERRTHHVFPSVAEESRSRGGSLRGGGEHLASRAGGAARAGRSGPARPGSPRIHAREEDRLRELAEKDRRVADLEKSCKAAVRDRELATALAGARWSRGPRRN